MALAVSTGIDYITNVCLTAGIASVRHQHLGGKNHMMTLLVQVCLVVGLRLIQSKISLISLIDKVSLDHGILVNSLRSFNFILRMNAGCQAGPQ